MKTIRYPFVLPSRVPMDFEDLVESRQRKSLRNAAMVLGLLFYSVAVTIKLIDARHEIGRKQRIIAECGENFLLSDGHP
jgi:hypothetical protein